MTTDQKTEIERLARELHRARNRHGALQMLNTPKEPTAAEDAFAALAVAEAEMREAEAALRVAQQPRRELTEKGAELVNVAGIVGGLGL